MPSTSQLTTNSRSMNGLNTVNANSVYTDSLEVGTLTIDTQGTAPTRVIGDNTTNIATTQFVQSSISSAGSIFVDLTNNQTVGGIKTFTSVPVCSTAPTSSTQLTNKSYVDSLIGAGAFVDLTTNQTITSGIKTFNVLPQSTVAPLSDPQLANKKYVDDSIIAVSPLYAQLAANNVFTGTTNRFGGANGIRVGANNTDRLATTYSSATATGTIDTFGPSGRSQININVQTFQASITLDSSGSQVGLNGMIILDQPFGTFSITNTKQLGYTFEAAGSAVAMTSSTSASIYSTAIPPGVWLVSLNVKVANTLGGAGTIANKMVILGTTAGSTYPNQYRTFCYYMEADDAVGSNTDPRDYIQLTGVVSNISAAAVTYYVNARVQFSGITTLTCTCTSFTYTRIG